MIFACNSLLPEPRSQWETLYSPRANSEFSRESDGYQPLLPSFPRDQDLLQSLLNLRKTKLKAAV